MRIPRSPNWPIIVASGLLGGVVNWLANPNFPGVSGSGPDFPGIITFVGVSALLMFFRNRRIPAR